MNDDIEKRRQRSEEARRAALKLKVQQQKERERQIAADIANVDKKATKRTVFEDSDEDSEEESEVHGEKKTTSSSSKRPKLFDSGSEEEVDDGGDTFEIKNRHSGPKGEQLMRMEARFNSDPRFKLDDKFAETDSDDDDAEVGNSEKHEMKMEKDKNRELLSKILGKSVEEKKPKAAETSTLKARPFTRFDPENPEHIAWMKEFEASKNPQKTKKTAENEDESRDDSDAEEETKEKDGNEAKEEDGEDEKSGDEDFEKAEIFFKMDEKFSMEMKERKDNGESSTEGFSFLSMMGRKYDKEPEEKAEDSEEIEDETQEVVKNEAIKKMNITEKKIGDMVIAPKFFVDPLSDMRIKSLAANFRRTQTVEKVIDKWAPHRDAIFKLYKKQRRDAVKKKKELVFTNGKRKRKDEDESNESSALRPVM